MILLLHRLAEINCAAHHTLSVCLGQSHAVAIRSIEADIRRLAIDLAGVRPSVALVYRSHTLDVPTARPHPILVDAFGRVKSACIVCRLLRVAKGLFA